MIILLVQNWVAWLLLMPIVVDGSDVLQGQLSVVMNLVLVCVLETVFVCSAVVSVSQGTQDLTAALCVISGVLAAPLVAV